MAISLRIISRLFFALVLLSVSQIQGMASDRDLAAKSTKFTLDFYRAAFNREKNAVMSATSVRSTLALLYHVANEETTNDMQRVLGLPAKSEEIVPALKRLLNQTQSKELKMGSKVYHDLVDLNPELLPVLQDVHGVEVEPADFSQKQHVADSINLWADRSTNGLIPNFIDPSEIEDDERVILLNAIALDARWNQSFEDSWKTTFHFVNGDRETVMMSADGDFFYADVNGLNVLELPYKRESDLSMLLIMPTSGSLEDLIARLDLDLYRKLDMSLKMEDGEVIVPKFSISSQIPAKTILQSMGLSSVFKPGAFDVFAAGNAQVSELRQKAVINVDEAGTTAAAVTEARIKLLSGPSFVFRADRPFIYVIRRSSTKEIFFIGHYSHYEN